MKTKSLTLRSKNNFFL